jgi:hypothetical protein
MHKVNSRTYIGQPNEGVTVSTQPGSGGQVSVFVNGQNVGPNGQIALPSNPAGTATVHVALAGPIGATCVVTIAPVDGGTDGDFLMCLASDPAPVNFYTFSVAALSAVKALSVAKGLAGPAPSATRAPQRRAKKKKGGKR